MNLQKKNTVGVEKKGHDVAKKTNTREWKKNNTMGVEKIKNTTLQKKNKKQFSHKIWFSPNTLPIYIF